MLRSLCRFALPLIFVPLFSAVVHSETVLKLNELAVDMGAEGAALHGFKTEVESATDGKVKIELHFGASLGDPSTSVENMMSGDLDLFSSDLRFYLPLLIDEISGLDLPFMVPSNKAARSYLASSLFKDGRDKVLNLRGVRFLELDAFHGPHRMMASLRPISAVDDLKGLKLAIFPGPTKAGIQLWTALGVTVTDVSWADVPAALGQGRLDGVISPDLSSLITYGVLKMAPYVGSVHDHPQVWQVSINEAAWKKLDSGEAAAVSKAAVDAASTFNRVSAQEFNDESASLAAVKPGKTPILDAVAAHERLLAVYDQLIAAGASTQRVKDTAATAISGTITRH